MRRLNSKFYVAAWLLGQFNLPRSMEIQPSVEDRRREDYEEKQRVLEAARDEAYWGER